MSPIRSRTARVADPGDFLDLAGAPAPVFLLERPATAEGWLGIGAASVVEVEGEGRFEEAIRRLGEQSRRIDRFAAGEEAAPAWLGGFGFAHRRSSAREWRELPALRFVLPALLWRRDRSGVRLTRNAARGDETALDRLLDLTREAAARAREERAGSRPRAVTAVRTASVDDAGAFLARVAAATRTIAAGELEKVVLSRRRELVLADGASAVDVARRARRERPQCWTFLVRGEETAFVGSTPERLVRRSGRLVESAAIAGSCARGGSPREDDERGAALLGCDKNGREHRFVVDSIRRVLEPIAARLEVESRPTLLRLPEAQHLCTRVRAELSSDRPLLSLADRLHPTPAVCGVPRVEARRRIEEEEPDRGWYTGALGWLSSEGDGELVVALRSGLIDGDRMILRAGAGIVAASDPALELAETEAKLAALMALERTARAA